MATATVALKSCTLSRNGNLPADVWPWGQRRECDGRERERKRHPGQHEPCKRARARPAGSEPGQIGAGASHRWATTLRMIIRPLFLRPGGSGQRRRQTGSGRLAEQWRTNPAPLALARRKSGDRSRDKVSLALTSDQRGAPRPVDIPGVPNLAERHRHRRLRSAARSAPERCIRHSSSRPLTDHDDGICGALDCTLREAIARSNTVPGPNDDHFRAAASPARSLATGGRWSAHITDGVTITGPGARFLKISAFTQTRDLLVSAEAARQTISGLTIADGRVETSTPAILKAGESTIGDARAG